jgi:hypothetical protein
MFFHVHLDNFRFQRGVIPTLFSKVIMYYIPLFLDVQPKLLNCQIPMSLTTCYHTIFKPTIFPLAHVGIMVKVLETI